MLTFYQLSLRAEEAATLWGTWPGAGLASTFGEVQRKLARKGNWAPGRAELGHGHRWFLWGEEQHPAGPLPQHHCCSIGRSSCAKPKAVPRPSVPG